MLLKENKMKKKNEEFHFSLIKSFSLIIIFVCLVHLLIYLLLVVVITKSFIIFILVIFEEKVLQFLKYSDLLIDLSDELQLQQVLGDLIDWWITCME